MPKQRGVNGVQLVKILEQAGFVKRRSRGSHLIFKHPDGRRAVVPMHGSKDIPTGTLRAICKDAGLEL